MNIPAVINNCVVRKNGDILVGIASVTLPELSKKTETFEGAGTAGPIEIPIRSLYEAMTTTIKFTNINKNIDLEDGNVIDLNIKAALQEADKQSHNTEKIVKLSSSMKGMIKSMKPGDVSAGGKAETEMEMSVTYYKLVIDGKEIFEIDKFNNVCRFNGNDLAADIKKALDM